MKRRVFATHSMIRNILFFLLAIIIVLFVSLKNGITVDRLKIASLSIEGLYLKLDKKLVLKAKSLTIPSYRKKRSLPDLETGLDRFNEILRYFQYIELKEVNFKNDHYSILYSDNVFYMVNDLFEVATHQISRVGNELHAVIDLLYIKKYDIRLSGMLVYNYKRDTALLRGRAEYLDIHTDFLINKKKKNLYYTLESGEFTKLKPLIEQFKLPPKISVWITDKVKAKQYRLERFKGSAKIDKNGIRLVPGTMSGRATLESVAITFKEGVDAVHAKKVIVLFKNGNLYFELANPYFHEKALDGSSVSIVNLLNAEPVLLKLDLRFNARLDSDIAKILEAYHINLPLSQKSGTVASRLNIDVDLKAKKTVCACRFKLSKGTIVIGKTALPVAGGSIDIKDQTVDLSDVMLKNDIYQALVNGKIDLMKKSADLDINVKSLYLGKKKKPFFFMKNRKLPLKISFKEDTILSLPTMKTTLSISKKDGSRRIKIADISLLKKNLKNLPITVDGGYVNIQSKDFAEYHFDGLLKRNDCFIYKNELSCMTQIPISGSFSDDRFILKAFHGNFIFNSGKSLATLKNLNLDLKKFLDTLEKHPGGGVSQKFRVSATNSTMRYGKSKLVTDRYDLGILPNGDFHFRGQLGRDVVVVSRKKKNLEISADQIGDRMLHPLINFSGLQKGRYSLKMSGVPGKMMRGVITLDNGIMSNFKAYNNVLAFINTIPALATLRSPGFSNKGFVIKHGVIKFTVYRGKLLTFDSVLIKGKSATISGDGTIDLETGKINIDLAIQTARGVGNLIGNLPVVGYILTGKNKSLMTVGLHIGGTLERPTTSTSPIKDVLMLPFKILERTFVGQEEEDPSKNF